MMKCVKKQVLEINESSEKSPTPNFHIYFKKACDQKIKLSYSLLAFQI